jgi:hypothetical protein
MFGQHYREIFNVLKEHGIKVYPMSQAVSDNKEPHVVIQHFGPMRNSVVSNPMMREDYYYLWCFYTKDSYTGACDFTGKVAEAMEGTRFNRVYESISSEINQSKLMYQFRLTYKIKRYKGGI